MSSDVWVRVPSRAPHPSSFVAIRCQTSSTPQANRERFHVRTHPADHPVAHHRRRLPVQTLRTVRRPRLPGNPEGRVQPDPAGRDHLLLRHEPARREPARRVGLRVRGGAGAHAGHVRLLAAQTRGRPRVPDAQRVGVQRGLLLLPGPAVVDRPGGAGAGRHVRRRQLRDGLGGHQCDDADAAAHPARPHAGRAGGRRGADAALHPSRRCATWSRGSPHRRRSTPMC